jgi:hypothetical protein
MNSSASPRLCGNFISACEKNRIMSTQFILTVSIAEQTVSLFEQNKFAKKISLNPPMMARYIYL